MRLIGSRPCIVILTFTILLFPFLTFCKTVSDSGQPRSIFIKEVLVQGNKKTCLEVVNHFLQIDTGMVFDSLLIEKAKKRLESTDLFLKVNIFALTKNDGVHIYVILIEGFFYAINDIGGEYYLYKHRIPDFWWRFHIGVENKNFRGKMEVLRTQISFWDFRSFGVSWQKPLFPSPYYFGVNMGVEQGPESAQWIDHLSLFGRLSIGRNLLAHSNVFLGISPMYQKLNIHFYKRDTTIIYEKSSVLSDTTLNLKTIIDTTLNFKITKAYELFTNLSSTIDYRNKKFDPNSGCLFFTDIRTNALYSGVVVPFFQLTNEFRWYIPMPFKDHKIASRIRTQFRDKNTGYVNRLQYGGDGSIRGYFKGEFPRKAPVTDAIMFSTEYRFPIYRFQAIRVPILANYSTVFNAFNYRLDGALILDYGRMGQSLSELFDINGDIESGAGIGFGFHVMIPALEKSANFDLVWGEDPTSTRKNIRFSKEPTWHLYVDLHY